MIFYTLSPSNVPENPHLFPTMKNSFINAGHSFTDVIENCECFLIDLHTRISDYCQSEISYILGSGKPICTWDEFDKGGMSFEDWPNPLTSQQIDIFVHIIKNEIPSVHFCRLLNKNNKYPSNVYPFERAIIYEEPPVSADELFNREYDVVFIANDSPSRRRIAYALLNDDRLNCFVSVGNPKLPFNEFLDLHKQGKFFVSSGAGGFTDERVQCLFSIAGIIRERSDQLLLHDFTHGENCLRVSNPPTQKDLDDIYEAVNNKERLYDIYKTGYDFVKKYYSAEYISNDILSKIQKHGLI